MDKKAELLEAIAGKNRGLLASEIDRVRVLSIIEQLEDYNPTPKPIEAKELLEGDWRLIYTTSRNLLGLDRFPLLKLGNIYQCIRTANSKVYNIAEMIGIPFLEGLIAVAASFEPVSEKRVNVKFERSIICGQRLINYDSPKAFIQELESEKKLLAIDFRIDNRNQNPWLDVTYLDTDLRISRGNEGSVFVLGKQR